MSFTKESGDLFAHPSQALAHGVNCVGVVGGLASVMADRFPDAMSQYAILATSGKISPGSAVLTWNAGRDPGPGRPIIHCASQLNPGPHATEQWLRASLSEGLNRAAAEGIESVALPLIGGGIGGLDPVRAEQIIREVSDASPVHVTLVVLG